MSNKFKKQLEIKVGGILNPVAKNAHKFNKSQVFIDQKKTYRRNNKHKGLIPFKKLWQERFLKGVQAQMLSFAFMSA